MCPSLIEIGSKTAEKNTAQTNRQTNRQTDTTKIMVNFICNQHGERLAILDTKNIKICG